MSVCGKLTLESDVIIPQEIYFVIVLKRSLTRVAASFFASYSLVSALRTASFVPSNPVLTSLLGVFDSAEITP